MLFPESLKYSANHQWLNAADGTVGITDFAQKKLGTIVYIELPEVGQTIKQGDNCGTIESTKAASDMFAPVSGTIIAINEELLDDPEIVNKSPYEGGWFFKVEIDNTKEIDNLLDSGAYADLAK